MRGPRNEPELVQKLTQEGAELPVGQGQPGAPRSGGSWWSVQGKMSYPYLTPYTRIHPKENTDRASENKNFDFFE